MVVVVLENAPPRLRGRLRLWLIEVRTGVYVGAGGGALRSLIWAEIEREIGAGGALMMWRAPAEEGFDWKATGPGQMPSSDFDGLRLPGHMSRETK